MKVCALSHQPVACLMHVLRRATEATLQGEDGGAFLPACGTMTAPLLLPHAFD